MNDLSTGSLISIGQLYNNECIAIFSKHCFQILKEDKIIITVTRNNKNGLCNTLLTLRPSQVTASALPCQYIKSDIAAFLHRAAFSPIPSTFLCAITQIHFSSWPVLTASLIKKHILKSLATSKGHL